MGRAFQPVVFFLLNFCDTKKMTGWKACPTQPAQSRWDNLSELFKFPSQATLDNRESFRQFSLGQHARGQEQAHTDRIMPAVI